MTTYAVLPIMIAASVVLLFRFINQKYNPPIFGVYRRRNKYFWFKFVVMYFILRARQLIAHLKSLFAVEFGNSGDGTVHIHEKDVALEKKYNLGDYPQVVGPCEGPTGKVPPACLFLPWSSSVALLCFGLKDKRARAITGTGDIPTQVSGLATQLSLDAVYFNGASKEGAALVCGVALKQEFYCDSFMYLKVNEDLLLSPEIPETRQKQTLTEEREYKMGGLSISNIIPMRSWKVAYDGEMRFKNDPNKKAKVMMDLTWSANWSPFNYDTDMSPLSMAKDMAREPWSADYFKWLKKVHQTHYEQMGVLTGTVLVDGKQHKLNLACVRDHTFGIWREWRNFHRYILHFIFLENGDCTAIGVVCQPIVLSHLTIGYFCRKSDQAVMPVKECDLKIWQHGENQIMPIDYGFTFKAGGERYDVQVQVNEEDFFFIGGRAGKIYERWSKFEVNGVKGWGCLEWHYNNLAAAAAQ